MWWSEDELVSQFLLINLEQLLHSLACDIPPNSLPLRLRRVSRVKMLMKCLTGENTLAWELAWSGIPMAACRRLGEGLSEPARLWGLLL